MSARRHLSPAVRAAAEDRELALRVAALKRRMERGEPAKRTHPASPVEPEGAPASVPPGHGSASRHGSLDGRLLDTLSRLRPAPLRTAELAQMTGEDPRAVERALIGLLASGQLRVVQWGLP